MAVAVTREPGRFLGLARRGRLFHVTRVTNWALGPSVSLKKGPSARGLQAAPHSEAGTRALLEPCAPAFRRVTRRCALRRCRHGRCWCCCTLPAAYTRGALRCFKEASPYLLRRMLVVCLSCSLNHQAASLNFLCLSLWS